MILKNEASWPPIKQKAHPMNDTRAKQSHFYPLFFAATIFKCIHLMLLIYE